MRILVIIVAVLFLSSCGDKAVDTEKAWTYEIIKIDGMTCVKWASGGYSGGLTCNWDEWEKSE